MKKTRVSLTEMKRGIELDTGEEYTLIVPVDVYRVEIEDAFFQTASAVFLPDAPLAFEEEGDEADEVGFWDDELWKALHDSHPAFADNLQKQPYLPESADGSPHRVAGVGRLATALRFLQKNKTHQLLIAGHTDRAGAPDYNQKLSEARAKVVLALLEGKREVFVETCNSYHVSDDDAVFVRYAARTRAWPCDLHGDRQASAQVIKQFQTSYNQEFSAKIAIDGVVGQQTLGAYYDILADEFAATVGGRGRLEALRGEIRFVSNQHRLVGFGEKYPADPSEPDGTRCQSDRRVEMLFFEPPHLPDLSNPEKAGHKIYVEKLFTPVPLPPDAITPDSGGGAASGDFQLVDAEPPEPGVGEPEEELVTAMDCVQSAQDPQDRWAFLEPLDEAHCEQGDWPYRSDPDGTALA